MIMKKYGWQNFSKITAFSQKILVKDVCVRRKSTIKSHPVIVPHLGLYAYYRELLLNVKNHMWITNMFFVPLTCFLFRCHFFVKSHVMWPVIWPFMWHVMWHVMWRVMWWVMWCGFMNLVWKVWQYCGNIAAFSWQMSPNKTNKGRCTISFNHLPSLWGVAMPVKPSSFIVT